MDDLPTFTRRKHHPAFADQPRCEEIPAITRARSAGNIDAGNNPGSHELAQLRLYRTHIYKFDHNVSEKNRLMFRTTPVSQHHRYGLLRI